MLKVNSQIKLGVNWIILPGHSDDLKSVFEMVKEINNTELLCKKKPHISKVVFFNFFLEICTKANNYS